MEKAEEEKKRQEEIAQKRQQEYEQWKDLFTVEQTGSDVLDENAKAARNNEIIKFIKVKN